MSRNSPTLPAPPGLLPSALSMVFPSLEFSGIGAPTVEGFIAALETQLEATRSAKVEGQIASRLTGRALLWYVHCTSPPEANRVHNEEAYLTLREQLTRMFSRQNRTPQSVFNCLTQGVNSTNEYFEKYCLLALRANEGIDNYFRHVWWIHGLQPELRDFALDRMANYRTFTELVQAVHVAERELLRKYAPRFKFQLTPVTEGTRRSLPRENGN
ncbi:hypothetical protein A1Q1_04844 [Trichosporon asahii var. asahii CBS 2479]|uniref:Uncharacterized protein n=1 Tax=Trichosporon asahii var. asahii (strain ATCC 90039 / CBS 2479 / JCM 2466 / KCTC 7840 / NBRC 103889/ NCYC 2677 / UAMH 7654) TaxID=1186058 RepID=J6EQ29_TRIAS|nr:hypothetical protein A1Q1_04844 [Trichosporon asahii var. asahii CBS 2479]EJT46549.1 hypothetical protein A1Q1_04844 [Trichosporon asahii var. asahii CBS 2479]